MKGIIRQTAATCCIGATLFTVLGCYHYQQVVDPCWMERYDSMARQSVRELNGAQTAQGHKLEQTIWNVYFDRDAKTEEGGIVLSGAGMHALRQLARKEPVPDFQLWLQYAYDVKDPGRREIVMEQRKDAIRVFLTSQTKFGNGDAYHIDVHDLDQPTYPAEWSLLAILNVERNIKAATGQTFPTPQQSTGGGK